MEKSQIEKDLEWVENLIEHLKRTNDERNIRNSLWILQKRKKSLEEMLHNTLAID